MNRVLWRATALAAALTMVAGVAQVSGAPKPKVSPAQVTGTYTYVYPTGSNQNVPCNPRPPPRPWIRPR